MLSRTIIETEDGSHTLYISELDEHYHSTRGAIQESKHVYINSGLAFQPKKNIVVFEVGFGTGLNAWLSYLEAENSQRKIAYYSIEKYPLMEEEFSKLNYATNNERGDRSMFLMMHTSPWNSASRFGDNFQLIKLRGDLVDADFDLLPLFDVVFFDAFAPNKQSNLWNIEIFSKIFQHCNEGAIFVTYCAKGSVRRELIEVGFSVERLSGPPGKHHMLRAIKG